MYDHFFSPPPRSRGFTLIELLAVLAVIALVVGLILPTISSMRASANDTGCKSNLRQLAQGFTLFAIDHDNRLPPNLHENQSPYFNQDRRYLAHSSKLGPYIGAPVPGKGLWTTNLQDMCYAEHMLCPSRAGMPGDNRDMFRLNKREVEMTNASKGKGSPWGTGSASKDFLNASNPQLVKSQKLSWIVDPADTWLIADLDQEFPVGDTSQKTVESPVHKDHRNVIFFDMHTGELGLEPSLYRR